jgi:hypothetical protein
LVAGLATTTLAQNQVLTQHNDTSRTGANTHESILTPSNVNTNTFGKLFSQPVDGYVYAQPLYLPGVTLATGASQAGTKHNVVFIATEHDSVYAFDADSALGANASPLWQITLLDAAHGAAAGATTVPSSDVSTTDLVPEIGITSTPVIDPTSNTIYVVGKTKENGTYVQRLHALDVTSGAEKFGGPMGVTASVTGNGIGSVSGVLSYDPKWENQRAGLLLLNGIVYFASASHQDTGPWHGWVLAYNAGTLQQTGAWCSTPNAQGENGAGIWMSGAGLAAVVPDPVNHPYGQMFVATGNGTFDAVAPNYTNNMDYGDSVIKLDLTSGVPSMVLNGVTVGDLFAPHDQATLSSSDKDQGSGGVLILPSSVGGGNNLLIQVGKTGRVYVLNQANLGGYNPNNTTDPEQQATINGLFSVPAYWNGNVYFWGVNDHLKAFSFSSGAISANPTSTSAETIAFPGATPTVSANGNSNGIVWDIRSDGFSGSSAGILYAHSATSVATLLYSSAQNPTRDAPAYPVKFSVPTVVNGKVYVGAQYQVSVYGLLKGATQASTPVISPGSQSFSTSLQLTITDSSSNAQIYYTTDGSTPTAASNLYGGPITVTSTETIQAISTGTGYLASPVASATYTYTTQAAPPMFAPAPGDYVASQSVTLSTPTPGATIYYTTDGSAPTTSSSVYSGPLGVSGSETIRAIAVASGLQNSVVANGLYTIQSGATSAINFGSGFTPGGMNFVGKSVSLNGTRLRLTNSGYTEAAAAWYPTPVNVQAFSTDFSFQQVPGSNPIADGMTFTIQNAGLSAVGPDGGGLGYGAFLPGDTPGIPTSVAVKFDLFSNDGEGDNSTGLYTNGASPTKPATTLGGGVNLQSGDIFAVHITYNGSTLTMTITDTANTSDTFTTSWPVNIPSTVGGNTAYVGFTAGTGHYTSIQDVLQWTYTATGSGRPTAATPAIAPATGTYTSAQTVTITDATSGTTIYYTTDGSQPSTSSLQYTAPFTVTATESVTAMAAASGYANSATANSVITISESAAATPVISPATGTYTAAQTVTITDGTSGASIYYTTDGSQPTTASAKYSSPFAVSSTTTVNAIATASGYTTSGTGTSVITIQSGGTNSINYASGFTATGMQLDGRAVLSGNILELTNGGPEEASSAWFTTPVNIQTFTTDFTFQQINPNADGLTFTVQNQGLSALGPWGGGLGYGEGTGTPTGTPITSSVAVKFDLFQNSHEGNNSTGLYTDGAAPTSPATTLGGGVNLHSGDVFHVHITYDGTNLTMTITDTTNTAETFTISWPINIPATVGANTAYVGFTAGTGSQSSTQEILTWTLGQ